MINIMSVRRKSILTTEGFEESYVNIKKVIDPSKLSGVVKINGAPDEQGGGFTIEEGKLYYNKDNRALYLGTRDNDYEMLITDASLPDALANNFLLIHSWRVDAVQQHIDDGSDSPTPGAYDIYPYTIPRGTISPSNSSLTLYCKNSPSGVVTTAVEYCFYYTQSGSTVPTIRIYRTGGTVVIPSSTAEVISGMEDGHTYEFNIFNNVLLVTDITAS